MSTRISTEEVTATKSEKFLAVILAAFVLMGTGWFYWKTYDWIGPDDAWQYTTSEQTIVDKALEAEDDFWAVEERANVARQELDQARADLSLAVSQGKPTKELEEKLAQARAESDVITAELKEAQAKKVALDAQREQVEKTVEKRAEEAQTGPERLLIAGVQLAVILAMLFGSIAWTKRLRERDSRWLPMSFAITAAGTIMAFVFVVDYITDWIDFLELGPIVLSLLGIAVTMSAFVALQKYLTRRIPRARVRKGECPFCAFPVRPDQEHCEGCGREVIAACATCGERRRVGSPHCGHCGAS